MATAYTNIDALGWFLTGAASDAATQGNPDLCLGGYRSNVEHSALDFLVESVMPPIRIDWISGANATGVGTVSSDGTSLYWTPASGAVGAAVAVANGETKLLQASTVSQAIRVTRTKSTTPSGSMSLRLLKSFNTALGMDNVTSAEATAGLNTYRALMLRNLSGSTITSAAFWIKTLGTQRLSGTAQLGASGSGTITTATSNGFADWPQHGWCRITQSGGTLREIVYYTSRTATSLTVPSTGRARLGTSASAGAGTDIIDAVPGIRIGIETASGSGTIQTIANDSTAPSGITWYTGITSAAGATIASLSASTNAGFWIHREVPAGCYANAAQENAISYQFTYSAVVYSANMSGLYRISNSALDLYEIYTGSDTSPTFASAAATSSTLPFTTALSAPPSGNREYHIVVRKRNSYNLLSQNRYERKVKINSSGAIVVKPPTAPSNLSLTDYGGGKVRLKSDYAAADDDPAADRWLIYQRGDGVDPDGTETPIIVPMQRDFGMFARGGTKPLNYLLGPYASGQDLRVLLRTRSSVADSSNTTATTLTVGTGAVRGGIRSGFWGTGYAQQSALDSIARTVYIDSGNNIYWSMQNGYTDLWADTTLVLRIKYDSGGATNNGVWTTFGFVQETVSGTPSTEPVEVYSWTVGSKILYITANGVRRMRIDVTNTTIGFTSLNQGVLTAASSNSPDPVFDAGFRSLFQVYDPYISTYNTAADLDYDGTLRTLVGWRQRGTVGAFE